MLNFSSKLLLAPGNFSMEGELGNFCIKENNSSKVVLCKNGDISNIKDSHRMKHLTKVMIFEISTVGPVKL